MAYLLRTADGDSFARFDTDRSGSIEGPEISAMIDEMWGDKGFGDPASGASFASLRGGARAGEKVGAAAADGSRSTEAQAAAQPPTTTGGGESPTIADAGQTAAGKRAADGGSEADPAAATEPEPSAAEVVSGGDTPEAVSGAEEALPEIDPAEIDEADPLKAITLEEIAASVGEAYWLLDTNRDAVIGQDEFLARPESSSSAIEADIDAIFDSLDTDGSGGISRDEYLSAATARLEGAGQQAQDAGELPSGTDMPVRMHYFER